MFFNLLFKKEIILFIYFWLCWVFVAARAFSLVAVSGGYSLVAACGLTAVASLVAEHGLYGAWASVVVTHGLYSAGSIVMVHGLICFQHVGSSQIRDPIRVSALAGRFFTTELLGKSQFANF